MELTARIISKSVNKYEEKDIKDIIFVQSVTYNIGGEK